MPTVDLGQGYSQDDDDWLRQLLSQQPQPSGGGAYNGGMSLNAPPSPGPAYTAADIIAGRTPFGKQEAKPYVDPTWAGQLQHKFEQGASGLGAGPAVTATAGDIGNVLGGAAGSMSLHDFEPNITEAYRRANAGQYGQAFGALTAALPITPGASIAEDVAKTVGKDAVESAATGAAKNMMDVPDIRRMHVDDAIDLARTNQHLITTQGGGFVGAPRSIKTMDDLNAARAGFDQYLDEETSGSDWYDRYRSGLNDLTGGDPQKNDWMSKLEGVWSAGVNPQSELGYVTKETAGAVTGAPRRANYTTQHNSLLDAIAANDPGELQLGRKTGQYADRVNPIQPGPPTATGVNDFRYANQWGFLPQEGSMTRDGEITLTQAQHRWLDYETANAVDRANQRQLLGRSDWTGEEIQAMPWVRQKAEALSSTGAQPPYPLSNYQSGLSEAMKTAPDYAPGFRFNETFEPQPGENIFQHLADAPNMTPDQRRQYASFVDPATGFGSSMTDPATGRDILHGGQRVYGGPSGTEPTGVAPYVMPTKPMQGYYRNNENLLETNPGYSAGPLAAFDTGPKTGKVTPSDAYPTGDREYPKVKSLSPESEDQMRTAAYTRSVMNSQQSGAGNISYPDPPMGVSNGYMVPLNRPATVDELAQHQAVGEKYGLPHAVDNGNGITVTNFDTAFDPNAQPTWTNKTRKQFFTDMQNIEPEDAAGPGRSMKTDAIFEPVDWSSAPGSGQVTQSLVDRLTKNPQVEQAYARNPFLPQQVQANAARAKAFESLTGPSRPDIWNTQQLMGEGDNWIQNLKDILAGKAKIPAATAAGVSLYPAAGLAQPGQSDPDWWRKLQAQRFAAAGQR